MTTTTLVTPPTTEHHPYYRSYIDAVGDEPLLERLRDHGDDTVSLLGGISEERAGYRYAEGKWSIKEVVGHVIDTERVFALRALCIGRGDTQPLPGFDEQVYVKNSGADSRSLARLAREFAAVRAATIALFEGFSPEAWTRIGTANESVLSARAAAYVLAGHAEHHVRILRERYL